jgi:hypothetical protein
MVVYVFCCNAQSKSHSDPHDICTLSLFYQLPNYNLFTQHVLFIYGETPLVNCGPRSNFLYIAITCLLLLALFTLLAYYYCFPLDTLIPLFITNWWDWQPHHKLGAKYLVMLCVGSTLPLAKQSLDEASYKLSGAVAKLASVTFWSLAFSWIRLNLGFLLRENLLQYSSYLPLGVPNRTVKLHQHRAASS